MPPKFDDQTCKTGLHILKDKWKQKTHMKLYCEYLLKGDRLSQIIESTYEAAPERELDLRFVRVPNQNMDSTQRERIWEKAIYERWKNGNALPKSLDAWEQIVAYQVPLRAGGVAQQGDKGWGEIDALGVFKNSLVVIELKREPRPNGDGTTSSSETPLKILLQSVAYAIAMQKNWIRVREQVRSLQTNCVLPDKAKIKLVGAVPAAYWLDWIPVTDKGTKELSAEVWTSFFKLVDLFKKLGFPISFVSLSGDPNDPKTLTVQPLKGLRSVLLGK